MKNHLTIRALKRGDLDGVRSVLGGTGLFPPDMLDDMAEPFLTGQAPHIWLLVEMAEQTIGFAYCAPERMTEGTFNLLAIAIAPEHQRIGAGAALVRGVEETTRQHVGRLLLVETSTDPDQDAARAFYEKEGFTEEGRIRDFYALGQTKVIFRKQL